jgi:hypothetical protein
MKSVLALAVALAFLAVGNAVAHQTVSLSVVPGQADLYVPLPEIVPGVGDHGDNDDITIWQESNGHAGLQETSTYDALGNFLYGPDTQLI